MPQPKRTARTKPLRRSTKPSRTRAAAKASTAAADPEPVLDRPGQRPNLTLADWLLGHPTTVVTSIDRESDRWLVHKG